VSKVAADAPAFSIVAIDCHERPVTLRLPFRFGAATVHEAPQAFVRARIALAGGRSAEGWAAELMIPKWFDKDPAKSNARNVDDLRASLRAAAAAYATAREPASAFGHAVRHYAPLLGAGIAAGRNALTASYGPALVDRALIDALCHATNLDFATAVRRNALGLTAQLAPDLATAPLDAFLGGLQPKPDIAARHTVGLVDPLTAADAHPPVRDDLPVTLDQAIARYGHRHFKLKLSGDVARNLERLAAIAGVLDRLPAYRVTLDGNEQFAGIEAVQELLAALRAAPRLARLAAAIAYLEQPLPRDLTLATDVHAIAWPPLLIDEADATVDAFVHARALGYAGVSSKDCKGVYKSLLNAARVARWNAEAGERRWFVSGEDLTCQAGLAVQQDLALVALLGLGDVERNGHHYVDGFAGQHAPAPEARAFLAAHPDLYQRAGDNVRLRIGDGRIELGSLWRSGFASGATPDPGSLAPLDRAGATPGIEQRM
jgi:hypothetical protein